MKRHTSSITEINQQSSAASQKNHSLYETIQSILNPLIPKGTSVALFDFPNHANVGDSAIWLGEESYLKKHNRVLATTNLGQMPALHSSTVILIHGGGNLGDLWPRHQLFREKIIAYYQRNKIIQLPQSIHFQKAENEAQCRNIFNSHPDLHLLVRDSKSLEQGQALYDGPTQLCPDMAFCLRTLPRNKNQVHSIVGLLRTDHEKITANLPLQNTDQMAIFDWLQERYSFVSKITTQVDRLQNRYPRWTGNLQGMKRNLYHRLAMQRLQRGCYILCLGQVVITDRLHGHILCTLMGIPHVVLDNSYRKIANFRDTWKTGEGLCKSATSLEEAIDKAQSLMTNCVGG